MKTLRTLGLLCTVAVGRPNAAPLTPLGNDPIPISTIENCPPEGRGGDSLLNKLKNRTDAPIESALQPKGYDFFVEMAGKEPKRWRANQNRDALKAEGEGLPVQFEGYLLQAKHYPKGKDVCNCNLPLERNNDFELILGKSMKQPEKASITAEMSPRTRLTTHLGWTYDKLQTVAGKDKKVRVSGWLLYDSETKDKGKKGRLTRWEIHPVTKFEVQQDDGTWKMLDDIRVN